MELVVHEGMQDTLAYRIIITGRGFACENYVVQLTDISKSQRELDACGVFSFYKFIKHRCRLYTSNVFIFVIDFLKLFVILKWLSL